MPMLGVTHSFIKMSGALSWKSVFVLTVIGLCMTGFLVDIHGIYSAQAVHRIYQHSNKRIYVPENTLKADLDNVIGYKDPLTGALFRIPVSLSSELQGQTVVRLKTMSESHQIFLPRTSLNRTTKHIQQFDIRTMRKLAFNKRFKNPCWYDIHHIPRCLPYFYLIGFPKCGTSDLYARLRLHPDVVTPFTKEPHWLTRGNTIKHEIEDDQGTYNRLEHSKKPQRLMDYLEFFTNMIPSFVHVTESTSSINETIIGDCSASNAWDNYRWTARSENTQLLEPTYTNPHYIYNLNPGARIIVLLRDPIARLWSDYLYFHNNVSQATFHNHVVSDIQTFTKCIRFVSLRSCVYNNKLELKTRIQVGIYFIYLREWIKVFPKQQLLFLKSEEYLLKTGKLLGHVFDHLELSRLDESHFQQIVKKKKSNSRSNSDINTGGMWPETKQILKDFYKTFNSELYKSMATL